MLVLAHYFSFGCFCSLVALIFLTEWLCDVEGGDYRASFSGQDGWFPLLIRLLPRMTPVKQPWVRSIAPWNGRYLALLGSCVEGKKGERILYLPPYLG